jgi:hypothetical protein
MFGVIIAGSICAGLLPELLPIVYRSLVLTVGMLAFLLAITAALEYALRLRVDEAIADLEFRS